MENLRNIPNLTGAVPLAVVAGIIDHLETAVFISVEPSGVLHHNQAFTSLTGYAAGEISHVKTLFDDDAYAEYSAALQKLGTANPTSMSLRIRRKDRSALTVRIDLFRQQEEGKDLVYGVITRPSHDRASDLAADAFYLLAEATNDIVTRHGRDFRYLYVNKTVERYTGVNPSEWIGKSYRELGMSEELCQLWDTSLRHVFENRQEHMVEFEVQPGSVYIESRMIPEFDQAGEVVSVLIVSRDLSEKQRGDENLVNKGGVVRMLGLMPDVTDQNQFVERLEQNEARFRTLANSISHLAWIADSEGWIFWYNDRWFEYTGTTLEEMRGWGWEKVHHPDHRDRVVNFVKEAWYKNDPFELTFPLRAKDGTYRWFLTRAFPITDSAGRIVQWVGTNTDIHDQKALAERLEGMVSERTRELQRSNDDLQQFAHVVSHDLKEPVRKITTFGNRLETELAGTLTEKAQTYLRKIMHACERLTQMIEGTLAYSAVDAKPNDFEQVDLNKLVSHIEADLEVLVQLKGASIVRENLPVIFGAPLLIYQLFYNLINNSLKFARPGVPPVVSIRALNQSEKEVSIEVSDNGIGFELKYAHKIFNAYTRLNAKDQFEGTGLGLALCKKIVERHNGTIRATSELNNGATFTITLPVSDSGRVPGKGELTGT